MQNFQDTSETRKPSFISAFLLCMTVPLNKQTWILGPNLPKMGRNNKFNPSI